MQARRAPQGSRELMSDLPWVLGLYSRSPKGVRSGETASPYQDTGTEVLLPKQLWFHSLGFQSRLLSSTVTF